MKPHTPIRLTVDFSHMQCQVGWGEREEKQGGKQRRREKSVWQKTSAVGELQREVGTCGNVDVYFYLAACEFYKCLTLLELIPIMSLQRAAVCQSLTPPLICRHLFSWMRKNSRQTAVSRAEQRRWCRAAQTYTLGSMADCQTCLQLKLHDVWEVKALAATQRITFQTNTCT